MRPSHLLAGVELGGTKCVCVLGTGPDDVRAQERIPTRDPETTLGQIETVIERWRAQHGPIRALGLASFGPLDLKPSSSAYGYITTATKPGWQNTDLAGRMERRLGLPVGLHTDVSGAALAEARWGAAQGLDDCAYVTVGTGVGVGLRVAGRAVFGCSHPELGHVRIARMAGDTWTGACSFHGDCVEGLACGPAIEARTGARPDRLSADHWVWASVAHALGQLLHVLVLATAPKRILMGGGVMHGQPHLFPRVREELARSLNGYVPVDEILKHLDSYVVPPKLGVLAGSLGALIIAAEAFAARTAHAGAPARGLARV